MTVGRENLGIETIIVVEIDGARGRLDTETLDHLVGKWR